MNKIVDIVFAITGIISLVGVVFLLYGISIFDSALNDVLSLDAVTAPNLGLDFSSAQQLARQVKGIVTLGYVWSAMVAVASLALILYAVADIRRQRSIVVRKK